MILILSGILVAVGAIYWQQHRLAQAGDELQRLRTEAGQLPALRQEVARLKGLEIDQAQLEHLRQSQKTAMLELAQLRGQVTQARRLAADNTRLQGDTDQQTARANAATNGIVGPMAEMMKHGLEQQSRRRLTRMQERLNLTSAQAQAIQDVLQRKAQVVAEATQGVLSGKLDREKIASYRQGEGDSESQIRALLSPEQQTAYAAFQEEEKVNNANSSANSEMLQMQHTLDLTEAQQKQVVTVLYQQILQRYQDETSGAQPAANPLEAEQVAIDRKLEALADILSPTQLSNYRQQQELQLKFLKRIVSQAEPTVAHP